MSSNHWNTDFIAKFFTNNYYYFVLRPTNAQLFHKLSHSYMFRHYRVILRQLVINILPSYTSISNAAVGNWLFVILYYDQQMHTIISQIITLLHVSTLSCHPPGALATITKHITQLDTKCDSAHTGPARQ